MSSISIRMLKIFLLYLTTALLAGVCHGQVNVNSQINCGAINGLRFGDPQLAPDGSLVVYRSGEKDLHSAPILGGKSTRLNIGGPRDIGVDEYFRISPDSSRVVYLDSPEARLPQYLYSVPVIGGAVIRLNGELVAGSRGVITKSFQISSDSSRVVYRSDQDVEGVFEIFSVPIAGGVARKLNGHFAPDNDVLNFKISPDSNYVVYRTQAASDNTARLFSVPIAGGTPREINGDLGLEGDVADDFEISPDSARVIYRADQDTRNRNELYSVPITGGATVKLNGELPVGGDIVNGIIAQGGEVFGGYKISSDSTYVAYLADQDTDDFNELYVVPIAGGTSVKISRDGVLGDGRVDFVFKFSYDSRFIVYTTTGSTDGSFRLATYIYSVPVGGGESTSLLPPNVFSYSVPLFEFSPNSKYVLFTSSGNKGRLQQMYIVPVEGGNPLLLDEFSDTGLSGSPFRIDIRKFRGFKFNANTSQVAYRVTGNSIIRSTDLFSIPITGGSPLKVNGSLAGGGFSVSPYFQFTPDGNRLVYQSVDSNRAVYSYLIDGDGDTDRIDGNGCTNEISDTSDSLCFPLAVAEKKAPVVCL